MATIAEARAAATAAGIPEEDQTPQVLKRYGGDFDVSIIPPNWNPQPRHNQAEIDEQLALTAKEIEENAAGGNIGALLAKGLGKIITLL